MCLLTLGSQLRDEETNAHMPDATMDPENSWEHFDRATEVAQGYRPFDADCQQEFYECAELDVAHNERYHGSSTSRSLTGPISPGSVELNSAAGFPGV